MPYIHSEDIDEFIESAAGHIDVEVMLGFWGKDRMVDDVMGAVGLEEYAEELEEQLLDVRRRIEAITDDFLAKKKEEEKEWPDVTDCELLENVLAELQEHGVLAGQRFGHDEESGRAQILALIDEIPEKERPRGYVFIDEESIWECFREGVLKLTLGAVDGDEQVAKEVGERLVAGLTAGGFVPEWDGNPGTPVAVSDFVWQRRLADTGETESD